MSLAAYTLNGTALPTLGASAVTLDTATNAVGVLTVTLNRPVNALQLFAPYAPVTLREGGTIRWQGWLDIPGTYGNGQSQQNRLVFKSAFHFLDSANYTQATYVDNVSSYKELTTVMLHQGYELNATTGKITIKKISGRAQIQLILDQLATRYGIATTGVALIPELRPPFFSKSNATLGSCLLSVLAWFPLFIVRSELGSLQLVNVSTSTLHTISPEALAANRQGIQEIGLYPRYDILKNKTRIIYQVKSGNTIRNVAEDMAATLNTSPHECVVTYPLEDGEVVPDMGLAAQYQAWIGKLKLDTEFSLKGDMFWDFRVGDRVRIPAPLPSWGTEDTVIQTIRRNLGASLVTLNCGARNHLGLDQLLELNKKTVQLPPNDGGAKKENKGLIKVEIEGIDEKSLATWTVAGSGGSGEGDVEVEPGEHNLVFHSAVKDGKFYAAPAVTVTVVKGGTSTGTGKYEETDLGGSGSDHAFKLIKRPEYANDPPEIVAWSVQVEPNSKMRAGYTGVERTISGLGEWMEATVGTYIYLKGEINTGPTFSSASISQESSAQDAVTVSGSNQTGFAVEIGRIVSDPDDEKGVKVIQSVHSHLRLLNDCHNGVPILYPMPLS